ncbi:MAG: hypothetical protein ABI697_09215 [Devosia sp.]
MTRTHEKLLIATLAGIIIAGAAAFAVGPAFATPTAHMQAPVLAGPSLDVLSLQLRKD